MPFDGFINIFKEKGMTSHDVVYHVRKILGTKKVGHTGTLDPNAEGVLIVAVGRATKYIQYLENDDKRYRAQLVFGRDTDTYDITGETLASLPLQKNRDELSQCLDTFVGDQLQKPPIYSALKKNGKKLYEYARKGESVEIPARPIRIFSLRCVDDNDFPQSVMIDVHCSKGTYIRSLCHDIGEKLECSACMGELLRLSVGCFNFEDAVDLTTLKALAESGNADLVMLPVQKAFEFYDSVNVKEKGAFYLRNGGNLYQWNSESGLSAFADGQRLRLMFGDEFIGLGRFVRNDEGYCVQPLKMM